MSTEFKCSKCHSIDFNVLANEGELVCKSCGKRIDIFVTQLKVEVITKEELREKLSELEHEQWSHWTKYFLENLTPENISRWSKQIETLYKDLSESEKDSDREWADKVLSIVSQCVIELGGERWTSVTSRGSSQRHKNGNKKRYRKRR